MDVLLAGRRVQVTNPSRVARSKGPAAAGWLMGRVGVVLAEAKSEGGAWVRMDEPLPASLRGQYPDSHILGRNLLLFPNECQPAQDRGYAPFHLDEFESALESARAQFNEAFLMPPADPTRPEWAWWRDVTEEKRRASSTGLGEHVYRFGVEQRKVTLMVYSTIGTTSSWSRPASADAIRFVHEVRHPSPLYLQTEHRVNRSGTSPLQRVGERILELMAPAYVASLSQLRWTATPFFRRR